MTQATTVEQYLDYITSEHENKPRFRATVAASVEPLSVIQEVLCSMPEEFDVDVAIGKQLDIVGIWIGRSRILEVPLEGVYFTWNDTIPTGWNNGIWKGPGDPDNEELVLDDDLYRSLLKSKILSNKWNGTIEEAYAIIDAFVVASPPILIKDNQDMTMTVTITTGSLTPTEEKILRAGYILIQPAGVKVIYEVI